MEKIRKQKLVTVCAVEPNISSSDLKFFCTKAGSSSSTHLQTTVKAPINSYNLIILEVYPESRDDRTELPCIKLSFMLLCYGPDTRVDEIRYNFDHDYKHVEYVDFSGPIGSMRLAFELLQKFPRCKEVAFVLNDYNAAVPYTKDEDFKSLNENWKVETVKIIHDFAIMEKVTVELQSKTWRLDEILAGCEVCFPNLKKFEVSLYGTGTNFDKVSTFVARHKTLSGNYVVEIINERVRCKPKPPPTQKMLTSVSSGMKTACASAMEVAKIAPIPVDLAIVKNELCADAVEQFPVPVSIPVPTISPYLPASINEHTGGIQHPVRAGNQIRDPRDRIGSVSNEGMTPPPTPPALPLPVVPYADSNSSETRDLKALCWGNEKGNESCAQHPLNQRVPPEIPSTSASYLSSKDVREKVQMQRLHSATSSSAYNSEIVDDEDIDERKIRMNRNPSPPVLNATASVENRSFERSDSYSDAQVDDGQARRIAPSPPVISRERSSELRDPRLPYRSNESSRSPSRSTSRSRRRDGRSRSRSYSSRSRSPSPSSRKRYYRPKSREYDRREYSDGNNGGNHRRRRHRSYSRSRSPSPGPSYYAGGETSRRGGYDDGRDRGSYRRNAKRPYYVSSTRRPRGRGTRGFRSRGGGRGRGRGHPGNRGGYKPTGYDNGGYFDDPRHLQDDHNYDDEGSNDE